MRERFAPQVPERLQATAKVAALSRHLLLHAFSQMTLADEEKMVGLEAFSVKFKDPTEENPPVPAAILGSDKVQFRCIIPSFNGQVGDTDDARSVLVDLFKDGAPFIPDGTAHSNRFFFITVPDGPPVMVNSVVLEYTDYGHTDNHVQKVAILRAERPDEVHHPSDTECAAIVEGLSQMDPYIDVEWMDEIFKLLAPRPVSEAGPQA